MVLARARPSLLFLWAPLPPWRPVPWAEELGRVVATEVLSTAQEEAQCWKMGLRGPRGGRAGSAGRGTSQLSRVHREGPKGCLPQILSLESLIIFIVLSFSSWFWAISQFYLQPYFSGLPHLLFIASINICDSVMFLISMQSFQCPLEAS